MSEPSSSKFWAFEEAYKNCHVILLRNKNRLEQQLNREEVEATINTFIERTKQMEIHLKSMWDKIAFTHPEIAKLAKEIDPSKDQSEEVGLLRASATGVRRTQELIQAHHDRMAYEKSGDKQEFKYITYRSTRDDDDDEDEDEGSQDSAVSIFPIK